MGKKLLLILRITTRPKYILCEKLFLNVKRALNSMIVIYLFLVLKLCP
jgi:hypothetical protein